MGSASPKKTTRVKLPTALRAALLDEVRSTCPYCGAAGVRKLEDPQVAPVLNRIGIPCLVEADVPISSQNPHSFFDTVMIRRFLVKRGLKTRESLIAENYATQPIAAENIRRIIKFPDSKFIRLTGCDKWDPALT